MIKTLQPSKQLVALAKAMFRHAWDQRRAQAQEAIKTGQHQLKELDKQIETLLSRIMESTNVTVIGTYETKIGALEKQKIILGEQLTHQAEPKGTYEEKLEPVLTFLASPWKIWETGHSALRRTVLKLAFADRIQYDRFEGPRTPQIALPFKALEKITDQRVCYGAVEKTRTSTPVKEQRPQRCASTNSATTAHALVGVGHIDERPGDVKRQYPRFQQILPGTHRLVFRRAIGYPKARVNSVSEDDMVEWIVSDGLTDYDDAVSVMEARAAAIAAGTADEAVWLVEHPPLYTAGTSARPADLTDPDRFPVHTSRRGGQYTYHGPGQRVAYVMLDLNRRGRDIRAFVQQLEAWVIATLAEFNLRGEVREGRVGVWIARDDKPLTATGAKPEDKIAAIGIRLRKWVSFHGISINVEPDLEHFSGIVPCGITEHGVTSLVDLGLPVTMDDLDVALRHTFESRFGPTVSP